MLLPVSTVEFLQMPASLSSGEYPLLSSRTQSLSGRTKATYSMHVKEDLQQVLKTPTFTGWSDCNMVRFGGDLYWIIQANTSTDSAHSIEFVVSYCGPSSVLHKGNSLAGVFSRLPSNSCPYLQRTPISSSLIHSRTVELPNLGYDGDGNKIYWAQVTCQVTEDNVVDTRRYGMFVAFGPNGQTDIHVPYNSVSTEGTVTDQVYPSIYDILSNPDEVFGVTASSILDVSISERCPYKTSIDTGILPWFRIYEWNYSGGDPVEEDVWPSKGLTTSSKTKWYWIESMTKYVEIWGKYSAPVTWEGTTNVSLSNLERGCGTVTIRDEDTANIATIPTAPSASVTLNLRTLSDYTGLYTYITYNGYQVCLQEGKLPWNGTSWEEYRAYSLAYDRQAMEQSIDFANQRVAVGLAQSAASTIQSAAMGAIGGNAAGAVTGAVSGAASFAISTWATMRESEISTRETQATQALAERRMAGQPSTPYNTGYGLIYCERTQITPCAVWIEMPAGLTSSIDADYTACFGYPAEGLRSVTIQEGYYKGRLYDTTLARGPRFDKCNEALQNGLLFKEV